MTHVTFGVSASSFISNMAIKQNAYDHANEYPLAAKVVHESFYMDDGLTGADTIEDAQKLQQQVQDLLACGGFLLHKSNCSKPFVIEHLPPILRDSSQISVEQDRPNQHSIPRVVGTGS